MNARAYIGTSGYSYKSWDKTFYGETPRKLQLEFYAGVFPTVEINATFYRLPSEEMVRGWRDRVPEEFRYAVKGSRFITHMKKLANLDGALDRFFERIAPMRERIAVILWQLPPMLKKDIPRLDEFLAQLPDTYRHAVEFRDRSWYDDETFVTLRRHNASHVALSSGGMPMNLTITNDLVYIRFHGLEGGAAHDYTRKELKPWASYICEQAERQRTLYIYFNNDVNVRAPDNARMLMEMIGDHAAMATGGTRARGEAIFSATEPRSRRLRNGTPHLAKGIRRTPRGRTGQLSAEQVEPKRRETARRGR
jgi:uncharacterized protein YecE (DUF72 family)